MQELKLLHVWVIEIAVTVRILWPAHPLGLPATGIAQHVVIKVPCPCHCVQPALLSYSLMYAPAALDTSVQQAERWARLGFPGADLPMGWACIASNPLAHVASGAAELL